MALILECLQESYQRVLVCLPQAQATWTIGDPPSGPPQTQAQVPQIQALSPAAWSGIQAPSLPGGVVLERGEPLCAGSSLPCPGTCSPAPGCLNRLESLVLHQTCPVPVPLGTLAG